MEKKIVMNEVYSIEEVQALVGCTITSVQSYVPDEDEGICIDCEDKDKNLVSFLIAEDGTWHFHNGKKKKITVGQLGEIAMLTGSSDIDSVHFLRVSPLTEIVIKPIGINAADRVLTILRRIFLSLEVRENKWDFEGELHPMHQCNDQSYDFAITVAVMPRNITNDIGGN